MRCDRCGKDNPADVHTCTPLALKLADWADECWPPKSKLVAAELRKQYEEIVRLESELEGTVQRNRDIYKQLDQAEAEIDRLYAENEALRAALKEAGLFLHHAWCDVQMNDYSFEKLNKTMEVVDAALAGGKT